MWQHIFWAFGHPEVYIVAIPAFAILSEVIPVFSRKPIFGYEFVAASTVVIVFLSLLVWAHHMFTVGLGHAVDLFFVASSVLIASADRRESCLTGAPPWSVAVSDSPLRCFSASQRCCNF